MKLEKMKILKYLKFSNLSLNLKKKVFPFSFTFSNNKILRQS